MARAKDLVLTARQRATLEKEWKTGTSPKCRTRCYAVLLKADGKSLVEISSILRCSTASVRTWLKQYESEGINGLREKFGWLFPEEEVSKGKEDPRIKEAVEKQRQEMKDAKAQWENESDPEKKKAAFGNYLKSLVKEIDV